MRALVESEGTIVISVARKNGRGVAVDRKASFMVFRKFGMNTMSISETKWFGQDVCDADGFLILHSGHLVPRTGERVEGNEGIGIVLDPAMVNLWKNVSEVWNPVSSRIVSGRLVIW
jgi:hypothetical protein